MVKERRGGREGGREGGKGGGRILSEYCSLSWRTEPRGGSKSSVIGMKEGRMGGREGEEGGREAEGEGGRKEGRTLSEYCSLSWRTEPSGGSKSSATGIKVGREEGRKEGGREAEGEGGRKDVPCRSTAACREGPSREEDQKAQSLT